MAATSNVVGGNFILKFGNLKVTATEFSVKLNPVTYSEQVASDRKVYLSEQGGASTGSGTLIITEDTDVQALLDYVGDIKIYNSGTRKLTILHEGRITDGLEHDQKTGLAPVSIIASSGEVVK
jgi:hypothetical protein